MTKPYLRIDDVEPVRLSGLPTASEVARKRKLAEIGKDLAWYNAKMEELRNEHGEPCCESCGLPEKKKLPSGQIKSLTVDTKNIRLICDSCANKQYKQTMRENVSKRQDREGVATLQEFWIRNRNKLTEAEKVQNEARHDELILFADEIEMCLKVEKAGIEFEEEALRALIQEFCSEVIDHGFALTDITVTPFFKPAMEEFYQNWQSRTDPYGVATVFYMKFGYLSALPEYFAHRFMELSERHLGLPVAGCVHYSERIKRILDALDGNVWKQPGQIIKCETHGCKEVKALPPMSTKWTPQGFTTENIPPALWFCPTHQAENDKKARTTYSAINKDRLNTRDVTRDKWGREKLYGEGGPYG